MLVPVVVLIAEVAGKIERRMSGSVGEVSSAGCRWNRIRLWLKRG